MLPIIDDHAHLCPWGKRFEAVRQFKNAGGTHLIISHMPYESKPILRKEDWKDEYQITIDLAKEAEQRTGVRCFCVIGPYPVDLIALAERHGLEKGFRLMVAGVEAAVELIKEEQAIGLGEVGRPHFEVPENILTKSNEIIRLCFERARDLGCAVVIHSEQVDESNLGWLSKLGQDVGLKPQRIVKHFCGKLKRDWLTGGVSLSVLASRENVLSAIDQKRDFMMETDYLDDPTRPGAVLSLATVPRRTKQLFEEGILDEKLWRKIHIDMPMQSYGIDTTL